MYLGLKSNKWRMFENISKSGVTVSEGFKSIWRYMYLGSNPNIREWVGPRLPRGVLVWFNNYSCFFFTMKSSNKISVFKESKFDWSG